MPTRKTALKQLDKLVGRWKTKGTMLSGPDKGKTFSGSDTYKWLPGNMFLEHTWNVRMPDGLHRGIEIFGYDPEQQTIFAHAYDADGSIVFSRVEFRGNKIQIVADELTFNGRLDSTGGSVTGIWTTTDKAGPVMEVTLTARGHSR